MSDRQSLEASTSSVNTGVVRIHNEEPDKKKQEHENLSPTDKQ